jgi:hypothetical protein
MDCANGGGREVGLLSLTRFQVGCNDAVTIDSHICVAVYMTCNIHQLLSLEQQPAGANSPRPPFPVSTEVYLSAVLILRETRLSSVPTRNHKYEHTHDSCANISEVIVRLERLLCCRTNPIERKDIPLPRPSTTAPPTRHHAHLQLRQPLDTGGSCRRLGP